MQLDPITTLSKDFPVVHENKASPSGYRGQQVDAEKAPGAAGSDSKEKKESDIAQLAESLEEAQKNIRMIHNVDLHFSIHQNSGDVIIALIDGTTGKVIREIPPSEILDLAARLEEMMGLLYDKKA